MPNEDPDKKPVKDEAEPREEILQPSRPAAPPPQRRPWQGGPLRPAMRRGGAVRTTPVVAATRRGVRTSVPEPGTTADPAPPADDGERVEKRRKKGK